MKVLTPETLRDIIHRRDKGEWDSDLEMLAYTIQAQLAKCQEAKLTRPELREKIKEILSIIPIGHGEGVEIIDKLEALLLDKPMLDRPELENELGLILTAVWLNKHNPKWAVEKILALILDSPRLDRPDREERIARKLYYGNGTTASSNLDYIPKWYEVPDVIKEGLRKQARQILLDCHDEEEIRRQHKQEVLMVEGYMEMAKDAAVETAKREERERITEKALKAMSIYDTETKPNPYTVLGEALKEIA